jgi:hypothetical protein
MLKKVTAICLIVALFILSNSLPVKAQVETKNSTENQNSQIKNSPKPDLKKVFAKEVEKSKNSNPLDSVTLKKLQDDQANSTPPKKWSKTKKFWVTMAIIGAVVGVVLLAIYAKPCPEGQDYECETDVFDNQNCTCVTP